MPLIGLKGGSSRVCASIKPRSGGPERYPQDAATPHSANRPSQDPLLGHERLPMERCAASACKHRYYATFLHSTQPCQMTTSSSPNPWLLAAADTPGLQLATNRPAVGSLEPPKTATICCYRGPVPLKGAGRTQGPSIGPATQKVEGRLTKGLSTHDTPISALKPFAIGL